MAEGLNEADSFLPRFSKDPQFYLKQIKLGRNAGPCYYSSADVVFATGFGALSLVLRGPVPASIADGDFLSIDDTTHDPRRNFVAGRSPVS